MLLTVDIGNSHTVIGIFDGGDLLRSWRLSTRRDQTSDEYAIFVRNLFRLSKISRQQIDTVVVSSVVPPLNECFESMVKSTFDLRPHFVEAAEQKLMPVRYAPPSDVGADRIVNAIAAFDKYGGPVVIVDFGTATTFDVVSDSGEYVGGVIAPGIGISAEALFLRAAKLPRIDIRKPEETVGRSTVASMQSGIFYGYVGLVDGLLERLLPELGKAPTVVATGGWAAMICADSERIDHVEPDLTLHGLRLYYERALS